MKKMALIQLCSMCANIFTVEVVIVAIVIKLIGDMVTEESTFFQLGGEGMAVSTLFQLLLMAVLISLAEYCIQSSSWGKHHTAYSKTVLLTGAAFVIAVGCIFAFGWFAPGFVKGWIWFVASFACCTGASIGIAAYKMKLEDKLLNEKFMAYMGRQKESME